MALRLREKVRSCGCACTNESGAGQIALPSKSGSAASFPTRSTARANASSKRAGRLGRWPSEAVGVADAAVLVVRRTVARDEPGGGVAKLRSVNPLQRRPGKVVQLAEEPAVDMTG
jgi:hypothetical protein